MKILFLNAGAELGGAERCLLDAFASFRDAGAQVEIHLGVPTDGPLVAAAQALGVRTFVLPMPASLTGVGDSEVGRSFGIVKLLMSAPATLLGVLKYRRDLKRRIAELAPDVIHSNSIKFHILTGIVGSRLPPVVWHIHDFIGSRAIASRVIKAIRRPDRAIAVSQAVADDARRLLPDVPVDVVYNAIDIEQFRPGPATVDLARLSGIDVGPETVRVGLVATYARWKGQDIFIQAAAEIARDMPAEKVQFFIIGGPIYKTQGSQWSKEELAERIKTLAPGRIGLIDFQADPWAIYRSLDVVVHCSTQPEPFGRTIVEAMACERTVIVARAGGAAELFTHGEDAIGFRPGDFGDLARQLKELLKDSGKRHAIASQARRTVEDRFRRRRLAAQLLAIYGQMSKFREIAAPDPPP